jgi:tRNA(Ile)-lysidine synthase
MTSLAERVLATIQRRALFPAGARVVAAVSGGPDSVALVHLLAELERAGALSLVALAHLDHRLRGAESDRDAAFCRRLAEVLGLPFETERWAATRRTGRSLEELAREARYEFFERARVRAGADVTAVGHTLDDQAETVLLRLLRGAGTRGLAGILPVAGSVVRPLLDLRRDELVDYLTAAGQAFCEDSTNRQLALARNRVRHDLLPKLKEQFGAGVPAVLARTADVARDDEAVLAGLAARAFVASSRPVEGGVALARHRLAELPAAIARRVARQVIEACGSRRPSLAHVDAVLRAAASGRPARIDVPGARLELSCVKGVLFFRRVSPTAAAVRGERAWSHDLPVPGSVDVPEAGLRCHAVRRQGVAAGVAAAGQPLRAVLADRGMGAHLVVRAWRPGDRLQPLGLNGRKKVQDVFVDRKVPRAVRQQVPIVTHADGRIVWVAGHAVAEPFRVTPATKSVVVLNFEPLGGPA